MSATKVLLYMYLSNSSKSNIYTVSITTNTALRDRLLRKWQFKIVSKWFYLNKCFGFDIIILLFLFK